MKKFKTTIGAAATLGLLATGSLALPAQAATTPAKADHATRTCTLNNGVALGVNDGTGFWLKSGVDKVKHGSSVAKVKGGKVVLKAGAGDADVSVDGMTFGDLVNKKGKFTGIKVNAAGPVGLNVWFDLDGDGDFFTFDDSGKFQSVGKDTYSAIDQRGNLSPLANGAPNGNIKDLIGDGDGQIPADTPIAVDAVAQNGTVKIKNLAHHKLVTCKPETPPPPKFTPSVLKAANKCRVSTSDKRNWWNVSNVAGGRTRTFWLHVSYGGKTTYEGQHSVAAGETAPVRTAHGGKLTVGYYDGHGHHKFAYAWSNAKKLCK